MPPGHGTTAFGTSFEHDHSLASMPGRHVSNLGGHVSAVVERKPNADWS